MEKRKITEIEREVIVSKHTLDVGCAVYTLALINIKTEKRPVQMKRDAEEVFYRK